MHWYHGRVLLDCCNIVYFNGLCCSIVYFYGLCCGIVYFNRLCCGIVYFNGLCCGIVYLNGLCCCIVYLNWLCCSPVKPGVEECSGVVCAGALGARAWCLLRQQGRTAAAALIRAAVTA